MPPFHQSASSLAHDQKGDHATGDLIVIAALGQLWIDDTGSGNRGALFRKVMMIRHTDVNTGRLESSNAGFVAGTLISRNDQSDRFLFMQSQNALCQSVIQPVAVSPFVQQQGIAFLRHFEMVPESRYDHPGGRQAIRIVVRGNDDVLPFGDGTSNSVTRLRQIGHVLQRLKVLKPGKQNTMQVWLIFRGQTRCRNTGKQGRQACFEAGLIQCGIDATALNLAMGQRDSHRARILAMRWTTP